MQVVDGDTLVVRLAGGKRERVRVLGIDAPELRPRERCAVQATNAARKLAQGKTVGLTADRTQAARDRNKRLLAYVTLPGGSDLGRRMVSTGYAKVYVSGRSFLRIGSYRAAEKDARAKRFGIWGTCSIVTVVPVPAPTPAPPPGPTTTTPTTTTSVPIAPPIPTTPSIPTTTQSTTTTASTTTTTTTTSPQPGCHASYPDFCIPPPPPDKDCGDFTQKNFRVLHSVADADPHRLDGNKDGRACES